MGTVLALMALTQRLEFRQSQSLVMTPQLMQAIKLLQLSNLDLSAFVEEELERNPLLERANDGPEAPVAGEPAAPPPIAPPALFEAVPDGADLEIADVETGGGGCTTTDGYPPYGAWKDAGWNSSLGRGR